MITRGSLIITNKDGITADVKESTEGNFLFSRDHISLDKLKRLNMELQKMNVHLEIVNDEKVTEYDVEE